MKYMHVYSMWNARKTGNTLFGKWILRLNYYYFFLQYSYIW